MASDYLMFVILSWMTWLSLMFLVIFFEYIDLKIKYKKLERLK